MDDLLPEEIPSVRESVRRFMTTEVVPEIKNYEARGVLPRDLIRKAGAAGFYGSLFPESVGGTNLGYLTAAVVLEEICRVDVPVASCANQQSGTFPTCIYVGGRPDQIEAYVPAPVARERI